MVYDWLSEANGQIVVNKSGTGVFEEHRFAQRQQLVTAIIDVHQRMGRQPTKPDLETILENVQSLYEFAHSLPLKGQEKDTLICAVEGYLIPASDSHMQTTQGGKTAFTLDRAASQSKFATIFCA